MRFKIYLHTIELNGQQIKHYFIVLVDADGRITGWTTFAQYCTGRRTIKKINTDDKCRIDTVVRFLNYVFFEQQLISSLNEVTPSLFSQYLNTYGMNKLKSDTELTHRANSTYKRECQFLLDFGIALASNKVVTWNEDALYHTRRTYSAKKRKYIDTKEPAFPVLTMPKEARKILRDLPDEIFQCLLNYIIRCEPDIMMLVALSAFAGLRPSEACNVRRNDSKLTAGIQFSEIDGNVVNVYIDLTEEKKLRSDNIPVGGIKRERTQRVYPRFLEAFISIYNMYMTHIEGREYEVDYGPLTIDRDGKAMTYPTYCARFKSVVKKASAEMILSQDAKIASWGHILQQRSIAPHIFRHWFSMTLAKYGEDIAQLQFWRGDKSPESAMTYLQDKSDLTQQLETVSAEVVQYQLWASQKLHKEEQENL